MIWGIKDIAFREQEFSVWNKELTNKTVMKLDNVGHYPHEEATDIFNKELKNVSTYQSIKIIVKIVINTNNVAHIRFSYNLKTSSSAVDCYSYSNL